MKKHISFLSFASILALGLAGCGGQTSTSSASSNSSMSETTSAHNHVWGEPVYAWSEDYSSCSATRICTLDESHIETETVNSTYTVVTDSTCLSEGVGQYTATFENQAFSVQTHDVVIQVKEHVWDDGEITRYPTIYEEGTKTYHCSLCGEAKTEKIDKTIDATDYTLDAMKMDDLTGVFTAKASIGADKSSATIGIPLLAKQNLEQCPAYESPAITQGAAYGYEKKTGPTTYEPIPGQELIAPYSYFRYSITKVESKDADGIVRQYDKLSGFDGTYYIIRLDVSELIANKTGYLHVKQTDNKALMVLLGMQDGVDTGVIAADASGNATQRPTIKDGYWHNGDVNLNIPVKENHTESLVYAGANGNWFVGGTGFGDGMGAKTATYSLANDAAELKDTTGNHLDTPYIDIIAVSSGKLVAGADAGTSAAPTSDISLSLYVDDMLDYNPSLVYDPASQDVNHVKNVMAKFYDDTKALPVNNATSYLIKGSDLEIDVMTKETHDSQDVDEYWSLTKAVGFDAYNQHTIKLLCEVPVLEALDVRGTPENHRTVILDVNSFDIQIANHAETNAAGLVVGNDASFEILDSSNTVGAELAIGNNATMEVQDGGELIIDDTCQLEVEYDAASNIHDTTHYSVAQVIEKITALPEPADVKEANRTDINAAKDAYDALDEQEKTQVTNAQKLTDCLAALPAVTPLNNGEITIKRGGKMINEGIINIEGLEVKPAANNQQETTQRVDRDMKSASLLIEEGGTLENRGCMGVRGSLYVLGTLDNYGRYEDLIAGTDPDKGTVNHHKGIQVSWKDDVTVEATDSTPENKKYTVNPDVRPGTIYVGKDASGNIVDNAKLNNYGDLVLVPGVIEVYGHYANLKDANNVGGALYLCEVNESVVPITPTQAEPNKLEERRTFSPAYPSTFNMLNAKSYINEGRVANATVEIISNGIYGALTIVE